MIFDEKYKVGTLVHYGKHLAIVAARTHESITVIWLIDDPLYSKMIKYSSNNRKFVNEDWEVVG